MNILKILQNMMKLLNDTLDSVARSLKQAARITQENADARKAAIDSDLN